MEFRQLEESVKELAEKVTKDVHNSREINYSLVPLGIYVADDFRRNFIFANFSAQAVAYLKSQGKKVNFVDLGSGTGINCLAAKLAGADKVTGIEYNEQSFFYARELMKKTGLDYNLISDDFLKRDFGKEIFDVVVNENLYPMLANEPQLRAAKKIRPNTHAGTIFIPDAIQFKLIYRETEKEFEEIRFDGNYGDEIVRSVPFINDGSGLSLDIKARLIDSFGITMVDYSDNLKGLPFGKPENLAIIPKGNDGRVILSWDTSRAQELEEILGQSFQLIG